MGKFALLRAERPRSAPVPDFMQQVIEVMVHQLGHRVADARRMVAEALKRNDSIDTPEALFEEVYRGETGAGAEPAGAGEEEDA